MVVSNEDEISEISTPRTASKLHHSSSSRRKGKTSSKKKEKKNKSIGQYVIGDVLGKGGFGVVYKGLNTEDGSHVAVKRVSLKKCSKDQIDTIHQEINLLKKLKHELIVRYIDHKQSKTKLYIIIEYVEGGSLQDQMKEYGVFRESLVAKFVKQVLIGLNYLHNEGVIHRDIKGANILTTKSASIKLADFGVAAALTDAESDNPVGTPYWMAPEIIELNPATTKSDIWSVGSTVVELLTGEPPYFKLDPMPALYRIVQDKHPPLPECSKLCEDFLFKCFQKDPEMRNSAEKLLNHPWIKINNTDVSEEQQEEERKKKEEEERKKKEEAEKKKQNNRLSAEKKLQLTKYAEDEDEDDDDDWGDFGADDSKPIGLSLGGMSKDNEEASSFDMDTPLKTGQRLSANLSNMKLDAVLKTKLDDDDDDYDDLFGDSDDPFRDDQDDLNLDLVQKLQQKLSKTDNDDAWGAEEEEVDFDDIIDTIAETTNEELKQESKVREMFFKLEPSLGETQIVEICKKLCETLEQYPRLKTKMTQNTSVLNLRELLETEKPAIVLATLQLIDCIISIDDITQALESRIFRETLCLLGILPAMMKYADPKYSIDMRKSVGSILYEMCNTSALTLQMFIGCGGLPVLVQLLHHNEKNFAELSDMVFSTIDAILRVFNIPDPNNTRKPKNDFCILFCKANLMIHLSSVLIELAKDTTLRGRQYIDRVIKLIEAFSGADTAVLKYVASEPVLINLFKSMHILKDKDMRFNMVKCLKNLALNPATFDSFVKVNGIAKLIDILKERDEDMSNQLIIALFSLTLVNKERQNIAAQAGIIPELQHTIATDSPMKYQAINLLCALAHSGDAGRQELWNNDGVHLYIQMLRFPGYQTNALEALREWITEDIKRVQNELCKRENIEELVDVFSTVSNRVLASMLQPLQNILNVSVKVNKALSNSSEFVSKVMKTSLLQPQSDVLIRVLQLKIVQSLYKWCDQPKKMVTELYPVIKQIAQKEKGVLVNEIAMNLLTAFEVNIKL
jgi:serine/threonine protein kinase